MFFCFEGHINIFSKLFYVREKPNILKKRLLTLIIIKQNNLNIYFGQKNNINQMNNLYLHDRLLGRPQRRVP